MKLSKKVILHLLLCSMFAPSLALGMSESSVNSEDGYMLAEITTIEASNSTNLLDNTFLAIELQSPSQLIQLDDGSLLVADTFNNSIRRVDRGRLVNFAGSFLSSLNPKGSFPIGALLDGDSDKAMFNQPMGMSLDKLGNVYVADSGNHAIRKIDKNGLVSTIAGNGLLGLKDGIGKEARFNNPVEVISASNGTLYVADTLNHVIRRIDLDGRVTTLNSPSKRSIEVTPGYVVPAGDYRDGSLAESMFNEPSGLALDVKGNLYVSDAGNQSIRYIDFEKELVTTVAGIGTGLFSNTSLYSDKTKLYAQGDYKNGDAKAARFNFPKGLVVTNEGGVIIADSLNHAIRYLHDGKVTTIAGSKDGQASYANGVEHIATFNTPTDLIILHNGSIAIADHHNNQIRNLEPYKLPQIDKSKSSISVAYGKKLITFDAKPEVNNNRVMIPIRAVAEAFGYVVKTSSDGQRVELSNSNGKLSFDIGQSEVTWSNNKGEKNQLMMDTPSYEHSNRVYVPIRLFAEALHKDVQWLEKENLVIIRD